MHGISSYRGYRPTHKQTHRQDRLQYTAPLSLARSVTTATKNTPFLLQVDGLVYNYGNSVCENFSGDAKNVLNFSKKGSLS